MEEARFHPKPAPGELRPAELDEEIDEGAVTMLAKLEERFVHGPPVLRDVRENLTAVADRLGQPLAGQRRTGRGLQEEVLADPLTGDEEPLADQATAVDRPETGAQRQVVSTAIVIAAAELEPRVAEPVLVLAE